MLCVRDYSSSKVNEPSRRVASKACSLTTRSVCLTSDRRNINEGKVGFSIDHTLPKSSKCQLHLFYNPHQHPVQKQVRTRGKQQSPILNNNSRVTTVVVSQMTVKVVQSVAINEIQQQHKQRQQPRSEPKEGATVVPHWSRSQRWRS